MDSTVPSYRRPSSLQSNQVSSSTQKQINMEVSPTQLLDDQIRADLFELLNSSEYETDHSGLALDWGMEGDLGYPVETNNNPVGGVIEPTWNYNSFQDLSSPAPMFNGSSIQNHKQANNTTWGGGTERVINSATGEQIIITFPSVSGSPPNASPEVNGNNNLDLFYSIVNENTKDMLVSPNFQSPTSDCVSYASPESGYSDSGISTSMDDLSSPIGVMNNDYNNFNQFGDSTIPSYAYSPSGVSPIDSDEGTAAFDINGARFINKSDSNNNYQTAVSLSNNVTSILEGALRGNGQQECATNNPLMDKNEAKMLTLMSNMKPLPSMSSLFKSEYPNVIKSEYPNVIKSEYPNVIESSNSISSSGLYMNNYDYHPVSPEDVNNLDVSFNALSTTTPEKNVDNSDNKNKKRKYTKKSPLEEAATKARLMHFCPVCQKGFRDKYSVNVHIRTHTGEKPFNCVICGKSFRQKVHLEKHVKFHNTMAAAGKPMSAKR